MENQFQKIQTGGVPIYSWCPDLSKDVLKQAENMAKHPMAYKHVCLMPDAHFGFGMPIGGVMACDEAIIPNAVGKDIGCGMCAVKTDLTEIDRGQLKKIIADIKKLVPMGVGRCHTQAALDLNPLMEEFKGDLKIIKKLRKNAEKQIGTLGGGNHFGEIQMGSDGHIWFMIHSGSRNLGAEVATYYNKVAAKLNKKMKVGEPVKSGLAFLPIKSKEGRAYQQEMNFCLKYAHQNRQKMAEAFKEVLVDFTACHFKEEVNIHHNYAALESHFGQKLYVHRKGATSAKKEEYGIIPGSQGSASYIVKGRGCKSSFTSCSHGAGRTLGRKQAIKTLSLKEEMDKLDQKGILHSVRHLRDLEEATSAYKDINMVMNHQQDLVNIMVELKPLAVMKGS